MKPDVSITFTFGIFSNDIVCLNGVKNQYQYETLQTPDEIRCMINFHVPDI